MFFNKSKREEKYPSYRITKTRNDVDRGKIKDRLDAECPICNHYEPLNGGLQRTIFTGGLFSKHRIIHYSLYTCRKCGTKWEVRKDN